VGRTIGKVLVTGGLGFIGSHVVDLLVEKGYDVRILDNLEPQIHGEARKLPDYVNGKAELVIGDVSDKKDGAKVVLDMDAVIHLAAAVGVGQSMYQIEKYVRCNTYGTANLLDILVNDENCVKKLVVASSMSIYGEGKYKCVSCGPVYPGLRKEEQLVGKDWEPKCPNCGEPVEPVPTDEDKPLMPTSIYAQTKTHQEEMCLLVGRTYGLPAVALRFFNVYGPRQALSNPYTGVCALFSSRILNDKPPYIFEDGLQTRDFVNVKDVAKAVVLALEKNVCDYMPINVGSGKPISIIELARILLRLYGKNMESLVSYRYRKGDVRHCYADISRARHLLGYEPAVGMDEGLADLVNWALEHGWGAVDLSNKAIKELEERKLI
jgi:dTDP-L-rhamnose 4-epimerase